MNRPLQLFRPVLVVFGAASGLLALGGCAGNASPDAPRQERGQLVNILVVQMNRCMAYEGTAPKTGPMIHFMLTREGRINEPMQLANQSPEPSFRPFAEASMRALRNCQPYRIPARFLDTYDDWKNVRLNIDTSDMQ